MSPWGNEARQSLRAAFQSLYKGRQDGYDILNKFVLGCREEEMVVLRPAKVENKVGVALEFSQWMSEKLVRR